MSTAETFSINSANAAARLAHRALGVDRQVGLLLPCNVVVRAEVTPDGEQTVVEAIDPATMVTVTGEQALAPVAAEAARLLRAALDTLTHAGRSTPAR